MFFPAKKAQDVRWEVVCYAMTFGGDPLYVECTRYSCNLLLIYIKVIDGHKHNSTMVSKSSPGIAAPKMNESFVHMAHVSSDRACAQDGILKRLHPTIIDGDMRWDSGWFWVVLG
jgi:hypothetical protein